MMLMCTLPEDTLPLSKSQGMPHGLKILDREKCISSGCGCLTGCSTHQIILYTKERVAPFCFFSYHICIDTRLMFRLILSEGIRTK